ncbi:MAG: trypsin-like peptidase domain-containing protein [Actinomycetota bacterium]|nr:trypsin-like peptidase domain-containing protein [Actinomycetota bacterium]
MSASGDQRPADDDFPWWSRPRSEQPPAVPAAAPPASPPYPPPPGSPLPAYGPPPPPGMQPAYGPPPRRWLGRVALFAVVPLALLLGLLAGLLGGATGYTLAQRADDDLIDRRSGLPGAPAVPGQAVQRPPGSLAGLADRLLPSVVSVEVEGPSDRDGVGSGFVIREDGYLLTNNHVVDSAADIQVRFSDRVKDGPVSARVVGRSARYDLAVLKVDARGLPVMELGDSGGVQVGDPVIAIGSPLGLEGTVTTGIISARNRAVTAGGDSDSEAFINAIQTDAAINPGNSGGPLVDLQGNVVGVNSAIATLGRGVGGSAGSGSIGLGFAIPVNQARRTADQIIRTGKATYPIIGVSLDPDPDSSEDGARIASAPRNDRQPVTPGGPADRAGLRAGDVITRVDDIPVTTAAQLIVAVSAHSPGEQVTIRYRRDGSPQEPAQLTLGESSE